MSSCSCMRHVCYSVSLQQPGQASGLQAQCLHSFDCGRSLASCSATTALLTIFSVPHAAAGCHCLLHALSAEALFVWHQLKLWLSGRPVVLGGLLPGCSCRNQSS